jgi:hypothetical protein
MKKIYASLFLGLLGISVTAQNLNVVPTSGHIPRSMPQRNVNPSTQATANFYVDYDFSDEDYQVNTIGNTYSRYIWDMNMRYDYTLGDTSLKWAAVDFNTLIDSYNGSTPVAFNSFATYTVDSVFILCGHSNYSGQNDTILIHIVQLTSGGYPTYPGTILHTDTLITNAALFGEASWLNAGVAYSTPGLTLPNSTKFGVRVEYYGDRLDTFGILCGFGDLGPGQCANISQLNNFAVESNYTQNSYRHDMRFALPPNNIAQLPTSSGADTYYDCDGSGNYQAGVDAENFLQNFGIWVNLTTVTGVEEYAGVLGVGQNEPNPFTNTTNIPYSLKENSDVSLTVYDVTGKVIATQTAQGQAAGSHKFTVDGSVLSAGVYYYTVDAGQGRVTRKMIIQ